MRGLKNPGARPVTKQTGRQMAWSTRQLAQIAGTTENTVRHYHRIGLLEQPDRASNGYKRYEIRHLVRLLRIRRMREVGISIGRIREMEGSPTGQAATIREVDAELEATIGRLERVREDLAELLDHGAPAGTPAGFAQQAPGLGETQRALLSVYAQVFDRPTLEAFAEVLGQRDTTDREFEELPTDADDSRVDDLARRMLPVALRHEERHPELRDPLSSSPLGPATAALVLAHAVVDVYHPAQIRVLQRLDVLRAETSR